LRYYRDEIAPALARRLPAELDPRQLTLAQLAERYLAAHGVGREASTIQTLRDRLKRPLTAFGDVPLVDLEYRAADLAAFRATLPPGSAFGIMQALRQTFEAAVAWGLIDTNPAKRAGKNPQPKPEEIHPFTRSEIDAIAVEIGAWGSLVVFASETGLRPSEWRALEWRDVDRDAGVVAVERTYARGVLKPYGKTRSGSRRRVPLSSRALAALENVPPRIGPRRLLFAGPEGGYVDLHNWRARSWLPALDAAGVPRRRIYDLRHSFATWALDAGVTLFELSRFMGTSIRMIDATYGHLAPTSEQAVRAKLDAHAARELSS
jgi:integrase